MNTSQKFYLNIAAWIFNILGLAFCSLFLFFINPQEDMPYLVLGIVCLLLTFVFSKMMGKGIVDERAIRVAAKANKLGLASALALAAVIAIQAKSDPSILELRTALGIIFLVSVIVSLASYQILLRMPNAEVDKRESK